MEVDIMPNDDLPGIAQLRNIVWGGQRELPNPHLAGRGKVGVLV